MLTLSPQQADVLAWAAGGATVEDTATGLGISKPAVSSSIWDARLKLGARNITHAVALAYQHGLLAIDPPTGPAVRLSAFHLDVLTRIAAGATGAEVAAALGISLTAVNTSLALTRDRLGARNATHAVALAYQHGLLDIEQPAAPAGAVRAEGGPA